MECPHCLTAIYTQAPHIQLGEDAFRYWSVVRLQCPSCSNSFIRLHGTHKPGAPAGDISALVYPKGTGRNPTPVEVDDSDVVEDYREACMVLADSPKASAALSRRCLQHILRTKAGATQRDLAPAIQAVIDSGKLPSHLSENIDAIRNIGNFAAHPLKDTSSGSILSVEPGEAEWNLDVIEELFDFYYVQPALSKKRRDALNAKLLAGGKPPMK